jgi:hypothetical protein
MGHYEKGLLDQLQISARVICLSSWGGWRSRPYSDDILTSLLPLYREGGDIGVAVQCLSDAVNIWVNANGEVNLFRKSNVVVRFPGFVKKAEARAAYLKEYDPLPRGAAYEEPFDPVIYKARSQICKQLNMLQRQIESYFQRLMPAFEDTFLSYTGQESLKEEIIKTPAVAKRLLNHPLYPTMTRKVKEAGGEEAMEEEDEAEGEEEEAEKDVDDILDPSATQQTAHLTGQNSRLEGREAEVPIQLMNQPAVLLATHQLLFNHSHLFLIDPLRHIETQTFAVRPLGERKALTQVESWVKSALEDVSSGRYDDGNPIRSFAGRAKLVMKLREEESSAVSADDPGVPRTVVSSSSVAAPAWNSDDLVIIQALRAASGQQYRGGTKDLLTRIVLYVIKECGLGRSLSTVSMGQEADAQSRVINQLPQMMSIDLLQRLGFVAPWENVPHLDMEFRQMIKEHDKTKELALTAKVDEDEAMRIDFDLPVYVIDDASAYELDDGVSIEATTKKDQYWIHISIADPTTALDINDPIAKQAQRLHNSIYGPDGHWSMLPSDLTQQYGLRVSDKKGDKPHANALQLSALLDIKSGKVKEVDVKLARLKDVRVRSYDQVDDILKGSIGQADAKEVTDLKLLHQAAIVLEQRRRDIGGAIVAPGSGASISLEPLPLPLSPVWQVTDDHVPSTPIFAGFPHIKHQPHTAVNSGMSPKYTLSHGLVSELMITANRIASKWASQRNLPALFGSQAAPTKADRRKLYDLRDKDGVINYQQLLQSGVNFSTGGTSIEQAEHFSLGIKTEMALQSNDVDALSDVGYSRVTSPLRRFPDLLNHWQLKQSMRKGLDAAPLISREELLALIPRQDRMNAWFKLSERNANRFYFALKLLRGVQSRKGQVQISPQEKEEVDAILDATHEALVSIAEVRVRSATQARVRVQLIGLGASAEMAWDPKILVPPNRGTKYQVKITDVYTAASTGFIEVERV